MENNEKLESSATYKKMSAAEWLDNYWYHYKWHTIVALFILIVGVICTLQMCSKTTYDGYVLYAGEHPIDNTSSDSSYHTMISAFKLVCEDYDENGTVSPVFKNLLVPSSEESGKLIDKGYDKLISMNTEEYREIMAYSSEYYICFLSEDLFLSYDTPTSSGAYPLCDLEQYLPEGSDAQMISPRGIYLSSTDFYKLAGINELPEDTVICLKAKLKLPGASGADEAFESSVDMLKKILAYEHEE